MTVEPTGNVERARRLARATLRPFATVLALAFAAGALMELVRPGSAIHPHALGTGVVAEVAALAFAFVHLLRRPLHRLLPRWLAVATSALVAIVAFRAAVDLRDDHAAYELPSGAWTASGLVALLLGLWGPFARRAPPARARGGAVVARGAACAAAAGAMVLAWIAAAGAVDYVPDRGGPCGDGPLTADAIVVFGSKVQADGTPSGSLLDRTESACRLWRSGVAPLLVLSGGRGAGAPVSEPAAMKAIAVARGVPEAAIVLDEEGVSTSATIGNAAAMARERGWSRVVAVSHDYHCARIRLLGARAGLAVRTSPARETVPAGWKTWAVAREAVAWAAAWLL
jgi:uncharacterized SAM-binding protein YcdF (DUF218 family)